MTCTHSETTYRIQYTVRASKQAVVTYLGNDAVLAEQAFLDAVSAGTLEPRFMVKPADKKAFRCRKIWDKRGFVRSCNAV